MEDLRSSEALEKEVLEDARKKAERILKNANLQIAALEKEWLEKKESEIALLNAEAGTKAALRQKEIDAAFPLEAQRRKLKFMDGVFEKFLSDFFEELPAGDLERVLEAKGRCFADFLNEPPATEPEASLKNQVSRETEGARSGSGSDSGRRISDVSYAGLSFQAAQRIVTSLLGNSAPRMSEGRGFQGLIFNGPGGAYSYRLTVEEITGELREYHRKTIMDALWKERN
jgi:hypothetical protein